MIKDGVLQVKEIMGTPVYVDLIPEENETSRSGNIIIPTSITAHNTGNSKADGKDHTKWIDVTTAYVSWHFTVDDKGIWQELPINEKAWHAGDGANGQGNSTSIAIEICEHEGIDWEKAKENAAKLMKFLLTHVSTIKDVVPHQKWSGKYCPHKILDEGWDSFKSYVLNYSLEGANMDTIKRIERLELEVFGEIYQPPVNEYEKIRFQNLDSVSGTDVHIYKTSQIPDLVLGVWCKREYLDDLCLSYGAKVGINAGFFAMNNENHEQLGLLITDNGQQKETKSYYQPSVKEFLDVIAWKDGTVTITSKDGYDGEYLSYIQQYAHWGIGTSYAIVMDSKASNLNWQYHDDLRLQYANRTMIGQKGNLWYLIVADGRTTSDKGLNAEEQQKLCLDLGLDWAVNLDGGGSSEMFIDNSIVTSNYKADRPIGTAFIIR